jgi:hypothetical protein
METPTTFTRTFQYRPWDGAAAFERAVKYITGTVGIQTPQRSFFGTKPPQRLTINVNVNETIDVPWGGVYIDLFDGEAQLSGDTHPEYGELFFISITAPRKHRAAIEGLFRLIQRELEDNSIYRGKAFDGQSMPEFVDLSGIDPERVVYAEDVRQQLEANIWSILEYSDEMRANGIPLKRSVLLHGEYGTGKTLAAFLTALKAVENNWTFVYCRPGKDDLETVMQTARLYQPSVVFFEDIDVVSDATVVTDDRDQVSRLLDAFDGITAKDTELMAILTTNHPEKIHKGMVRPGRLDAVIQIAALDPAGYMELLHRVVPSELLDSESLDHEAISESMEGFVPAFVKEAIDRAMRYAIARSKGQTPDRLTTEDFVLAANGLRPQLDMMNAALEGKDKDSLTVAMETLVRRQSKEGTKELEFPDRAGEFTLDAVDNGN